MHFFKKTNIDFMGKRNGMYFLSTTIILLGFISLIVKGVNYGIDFRGGTEIILGFQDKIAIADIRVGLEKVGLGQSEIKSYGSEQNILIRTALQEEGTAVSGRIKQAMQQSFPNSKFQVLKEDKIGPKIGKELRQNAIYAVTALLVVILAYIALRFKFIYGVGAVMSLFHDVLITVGILSILDGVFPALNLEITQEIVAALLSLVGLSMNDTVVVFDRIRENQKIYRSLPLGELMNKSLNETLSRTIITSGTIFIVLVTLLLLGGEVNRGFAFALTIGIVTGTYSSIYIASAIVLDWDARKKQQQAQTVVSK